MNKVAVLNFKELAKAVTKAKRFVEIKDRTQIISHLLLQGSGDGKYSLFATNKEVGIKISNLSGNVEEALTLNAVSISSFLANVEKIGYTDNVVVYETSKDEQNANIRIIECFKGQKAVRSGIETFKVEDLVDIYKDYTNNHNVLLDNASRLIKHFKHAIKLVDNNAPKIELRGIYLTNSLYGTIDIVSTDTYALYNANIAGQMAKDEVIIPKHIIDLLLKDKANISTITSKNDPDVLGFTAGDITYYAKPIIGRYVDYKRVIYKNDDLEQLIDIEVAGLKDALTLFGDTKIVIDGKKQIAGKVGINNSSVDLLVGKYDGKFAFKGEYMSNIISAIEDICRLGDTLSLYIGKSYASEARDKGVVNANFMALGNGLRIICCPVYL